MDNNKKVQMNNLEYKNMNIISPINPLQNTKSQVDTNISEEFKSVMKKVKGARKQKNSNIKDDILVEDSLKELIKEGSEINKTVEVRITESTLIKKILSDEKNIPSDKNRNI